MLSARSARHAEVASLSAGDHSLARGFGEGDFDLVFCFEEIKCHGSNIGLHWKTSREATGGNIGCDESFLGSGQGVVERVVVVLGGCSIGDTRELVRSTRSGLGSSPVLDTGDLSKGFFDRDGGKESHEKNDVLHHDCRRLVDVEGKDRFVGKDLIL